jgi:EAL domain-containing protein (putative c-di-GMP-specific phosphodiesterase class I)
VTDRHFAVIVGIDDAGSPGLHRAEDDARAVLDALCHPRTGTFDPADVRLFAGPQTTASQIKATLRDIVAQSHASDVLVIYFAGHSVAPPWSRSTDTYLVTPDLDLTADADAGLRLTFLKRDVLEAFAGKALLILDGSRPGTLPTATGPADTVPTVAGRDIDMISVGGRDEARYTALTADGNPSGVLSYHVLQGMRGAAADTNGQVTFLSLGNYVKGTGIEPGFFTQTRGRDTVLTSPFPGRHAATPDYIEVSPLSNALDAHVRTIRNLIDRVSREARDSRESVEYLTTAMNAEAAAVLEFGPLGLKAIDATSGFDLEYLQDLIRARNPLDPLWYGHHANAGSHVVLSVPLQRDEGKVVLLAVVNPAAELLGLGEPLAKILQTVWRTDVAAAPDEAEIHVLTGLRGSFGRLPLPLYERFRHLHRKALESLTIVFEPIVTIAKIRKHVGVHSYEALARRSPADRGAPVALLQAAHTWGDRLVVDRDEIIVTKTLAAYAEAGADSPWDVPKPVSVNVAVRSLLSDPYVETLRRALTASDLDPRGVTLEISEQDPIKPRAGEKWPLEPHAYFHRRLTEIGRDLNVSFAVDDFGSDYASLSRMAELPLTQIKVDRSILHHTTAVDELRFIEKIARAQHDRGQADASRVVIVEGVDDESPVTLRQIHDLSIRHVQGYITQQPAATTLSQLTDPVREDIAARVRGDDERRHPGLADRPLRRSA